LSKKNLLCSFETIVDAADKGKLYNICNTPELSERNFCDAFEIKFRSHHHWVDMGVGRGFQFYIFLLNF